MGANPDSGFCHRKALGHFRDTLSVGFERKNNFAVERLKLRQSILQPAAILVSLFQAIIPHELLLLFLVHRDLGTAPPHYLKSGPNGYGSQPSSEALLLSVCEQRPESFLRGILGKPLIAGDSNAAPIAMAA
jgi:hypothetical protein